MNLYPPICVCVNGYIYIYIGPRTYSFVRPQATGPPCSKVYEYSLVSIDVDLLIISRVIQRLTYVREETALPATKRTAPATPQSIRQGRHTAARLGNIDVQRAGPARPAARAGRAGTARGGPRRATGRPCRATTVLRAEGAAHGPVRGPFSRAVPPVQPGTSGRPTARQAYHRAVSQHMKKT